MHFFSSCHSRRTFEWTNVEAELKFHNISTVIRCIVIWDPSGWTTRCNSGPFNMTEKIVFYWGLLRFSWQSVLFDSGEYWELGRFKILKKIEQKVFFATQTNVGMPFLSLTSYSTCWCMCRLYWITGRDDPNTDHLPHDILRLHSAQHSTSPLCISLEPYRQYSAVN